MRSLYGVVVALMLLAAPAAASDGREAAGRAVEAARALQQQANAAVAAGKRLDMRDPAAVTNLNRIIDMQAFDGLAPVNAADVAWLLDWLAAIRTAHFTLIYFGTDPNASPQVALPAVERNARDYEDEITRVMVFSQRFFPRVIKTMAAFFETLPEKERASKVRLEGAARMRQGYVETIEGALVFAATEGTKLANTRAIVAVLDENSAVWVEAVPADARKRLTAVVAGARTKITDQEALVHLRAIEAAISAAKT